MKETIEVDIIETCSWLTKETWYHIKFFGIKSCIEIYLKKLEEDFPDGKLTLQMLEEELQFLIGLELGTMVKIVRKDTFQDFLNYNWKKEFDFINAAENHHFRLHNEYVQYLDRIRFFQNFPQEGTHNKYKYSIMLEFIEKVLDEEIKIPKLELPKFIEFIKNGRGFKIACDMWGIAQDERNKSIEGHREIMENPLKVFEKATKDEDFWNKVYEVEAAINNNEKINAYSAPTALGQEMRKMDEINKENIQTLELDNEDPTTEEICLLGSSKQITKSSLKYTWLADSGASSHMTNSDDGLFNIHMQESTVTIGNGTSLKVTKIGDLKVTFRNEEGLQIFTLQKVKYIPDLCVKLLSIPVALKEGF